MKSLFHGQPSPPDTSYLSQIPFEIFLQIAAHLPIESQFILSRTCRRARFSLHRDWTSELKQLSPADRVRCLLLIAYDLPDHLACAVCFKLHRVDKRCTPSRYQHGRRSCREPWDRHYLTSCYNKLNHSAYILVHNHVQLALKYTRLSDKNTEYRDALMKPYFFYAPAPQGYLLKPLGARDVYYDLLCTQRPKITCGTFLHESVWVVRSTDDGPILWSDVSSTMTSVVEEHFLMLLFSDILRLGSRRWRRASPGAESCEYIPAGESCVRAISCPTCRVEILFQLEYDVWVIKSWANYGTELEPFCARALTIWSGSNLSSISHETQRISPHSPGFIETTYKGDKGSVKRQKVHVRAVTSLTRCRLGAGPIVGRFSRRHRAGRFRYSAVNCHFK